ncbi:hypothetical protein COO60DRAFT_1702394 [Scenedesmus sp. NREL 46B-D3]|nr:hypothetical protein COO60DRAFT_1702394 [Scenedesmus sp. NREL 46B-D3]
MAAAQGLSNWQLCTLAVTLRDIQAGEELLEDYRAYNTPCTDGHDCPEYMKQQQQQRWEGGSSEQAATELPHEDWNRAVLVQSLDAYVRSSSSPGGGLGVFAARDLPAGTVWNKEDAAHALAVTRGQWSTLYRLEASLAAAHAEKPLITAFVTILRSHGIYCPLDDRMYLPLARSVLARQAAANTRDEHSPQRQGSSSSSSSGRGVAEQQMRANSVHIADGGADIVAAAGAAARCTWLQTVADVHQGEELVVGASQRHECDWPGLQPTRL